MSNKQDISYIFRDAVVPQPIETLKDGFVKWGSDNLYPQFLMGLFYNSPVHSGIINGKVNYITSGGLDYKGTDLAKWEQIKKNGSSKYTLEELGFALCFDNEILNEFYVLCVKNITTGLWQYDIIDSELIRNSENGFYFHYSENWKGQQGEKTKYKVIKSFEYRTNEDTELLFNFSVKAKQYILENGKLTSNVYPIPNYAGAIVSIMADIEMNNFHFAESVNSFTSGTIIKLNNGIPEDDVREAKEKKLRDSITERGKKGGVTILYADGKEREASIENINGTDLDKRYLETQKAIIDSTMIAHSVINPSLFGIKTQGQLGSTQELETSFVLFKQNYAIPRGKLITDSLTYINKILNDLQGDIFYKESTLRLVESTDEVNATGDALSKMSPLLANKIIENLTQNEIRALAKLSPLDGGDVVPTATTAPATFKSQDVILNSLLSCGVDCDSLTFVKSVGVSDFKDLEHQELMFISNHKIERFAEVSKEDKKILGLIDKGISYNDLVKELKQPPLEVTNKLLKLQNDGLLEQGTEMKISKLGQSEIKNTDFEIRYTYEKRPDAPDLVKGGESREFCLAVLDAKRAYLRTEIENISNDQDSDVWLYRGGWYHNPNTGNNEVACRHFWKMNIVIK